MVYLFLIDNFEEIEALSTVDILRRAEIAVTTVGIFGNELKGAHGISVKADKLFEETDFSDAEALILPGGMGSLDFLNHTALCDLLSVHAKQKKLIAAICAAPSVLGELGLLRGYRATCYPGFEERLLGATYTGESVCVDRNCVTARGPGVSDQFAFQLVSLLKNQQVVESLRKAMQYE